MTNIVTSADQRLVVFSKLWCISTLLHLISFSYWIEEHPFVFLFVLLSCVLHLVYPFRNIFLFAGMACSVILIWLKLPHIPNHIFFEWFLNLLFLGVFLSWTVWNKRALSPGNYFFAKTTLVTRWSVAVLYFYVVLHKLNYDFYDPSASCGAVLFEQIFEHSGMFHIDLLRDIYYHNEFIFETFSIYFTLTAEALIPVMLMVRRWRNAGIITALIFHLILSFHGHNGIFSFSAMLFTMFIFFWSDTAVAAFNKKWEQYQNQIKTAIIVTLAVVVTVYLSLPYFYYVLVSLLAWFLFAVIYMFTYYKSVSADFSNTAFAVSKGIKPGFAWIIPLLIFVNGFCPYLGLKTETSFSMFSNLRTEGNISNHQFIPVSWQIFDYQKNLITIQESDYERLKNLDLYHEQENVQMVLYEFVKILNNAPDNVLVKYELNNKVGYFEKVDGKIIRSDVDMYENPILKKFFAFRLVHEERSLCKH